MGRTASTEQANSEGQPTPSNVSNFKEMLLNRSLEQPLSAGGSWLNLAASGYTESLPPHLKGKPDLKQFASYINQPSPRYDAIDPAEAIVLDEGEMDGSSTVNKVRPHHYFDMYINHAVKTLNAQATESVKKPAPSREELDLQPKPGD